MTVFLFFASCFSQGQDFFENDKTILINAVGFDVYNVPDSVKTIQGVSSDEYAFKQSSSTLTTVIFTEKSSLETIGQYVFSECKLLSSINLEL